jgi:hypothetical protein
LDFVAFTSEFALKKHDGAGRVIEDDNRRRDRADLLAARQSNVETFADEPYVSVHLAEPKGPRERLVERGDGTRLTSGVNQAANQLRDYWRSLTHVQGNRDEVSELGWVVSAPTMILIAGSEGEFSGRPAQLDFVRQALARQEIQLVTMEDLIRAAENSCAAHYISQLSVLSHPSFTPLLTYRPDSVQVLDLSDSVPYSPKPPSRPQFKRTADWTTGPIDAVSRSEKYLFAATDWEQEIVHRAGATHIERLFSGIWAEACQQISSVRIVDPEGHSQRSKVIWLGAVAANALGLAARGESRD